MLLRSFIKKNIFLFIVCVSSLILLFFFCILFVLSGKIIYEADSDAQFIIDPAFAAGQGIFFPTEEAFHDPKVINILFLGTDHRVNDEERGRADSNMLCSFNTRNGNIRLISFERGIGVPVPGRGSDLLTHAYHWGGPLLSQSIISQMFQVDLRGYIQVDFQCFADIIDAIGGVDIELTDLEANALAGVIPTQVWAWGEVHEGMNHLSGHDALQYCRLRSIDSDWNRQQRQRTVLEQIRKKYGGMSLQKKIQTVNEILPMLHTNLKRSDVLKLMFNMPRLLHGNIAQLQVPDKNYTEGYIRCVPEYEAKKIANFIYEAGYELNSPY